MQKVFVLDKNKKPLMPCHPARARQLLKGKKAKVYRRYPFTIILIEREGGETQPIELKIDPGSKTTGISIVGHFKRGKVTLWGANLHHRGQTIKLSLDKRRGVRRSRRHRKTRYRRLRFDNRTRPKGWLPPSLRSRVANVYQWAKRLINFVPVLSIAVETVRFDTQKLVKPEISGVEYQQGTLAGYEVREYLLEKFNRTCVYCGKRDVPLEVEHIVPKSKGGSDRVSNLTLACHKCNQKKGNQDVKVFLQDKPAVLKKVLAQTKRPLRDAAVINAIRYAIGAVLKKFGLPVSFWSGGRTKYNRAKQDYDKDHWIDAACVGETGEQVQIPTSLKPIQIKAVGRGSRQMCRVNKYGFPRTKPKQCKRVHGFQTGDIVRAVVPKGKYAGVHFGRVAVRTRGNFRVNKIDINWKYCQVIQDADGYEYSF